MSTQRTISFRIPTKTVDSLDALAEEMERDRSYLLNEAVETYLEINRYQVELIQKGLDAARKGDFVDHNQVRKMISRMRRTNRTR